MCPGTATPREKAPRHAFTPRCGSRARHPAEHARHPPRARRGRSMRAWSASRPAAWQALGAARPMRRAPCGQARSARHARSPRRQSARRLARTNLGQPPPRTSQRDSRETSTPHLPLRRVRAGRGTPRAPTRRRAPPHRAARVDLDRNLRSSIATASCRDGSSRSDETKPSASQRSTATRHTSRGSSTGPTPRWSAGSCRLRARSRRSTASSRSRSWITCAAHPAAPRSASASRDPPGGARSAPGAQCRRQCPMTLGVFGIRL